MKNMTILGIALLSCLCIPCQAQNRQAKRYWNESTQLVPWRYPITHTPVKYVDLDHDGDPDLLFTYIYNGIPVLWIDDNDNMQYGDSEGDLAGDCLLIDLNKDGKFAGPHDLSIKWGDENHDGIADIQLVVSNGADRKFGYFDWDASFMYMIDFGENDGIHNFINWNTIRLMCWEHNGISNFFTDYHGNTLFLKMHASSFSINDPRYNWENPFIFYDEDKDGLSEWSVRMVDEPSFRTAANSRSIFKDIDNKYEVEFSHHIGWAAFSWDMDNDNGPGDEFDDDMSILFKGKGFDYSDQVHTYNSLKGISVPDSLLWDARWRNNITLIYPDEKQAKKLVFNRGKDCYSQCWFVFDEDDDCHRWERVEFYEPKDLYKFGIRNGGLDNNAQSDAAGDRGEWDEDNSGKGKLYISPFDGRLHLYGSEWGAWRIDQTAYYYQGFGGLYDRWSFHRMTQEPDKCALIRYKDTDHNGFFDYIEYDLDGDGTFEEQVSLSEMGINDAARLIDVSNKDYTYMKRLFKTVTDRIWKRAMTVVGIAGNEKVNAGWYRFYLSPRSTFERYQYGYLLTFYLYQDMKQKALESNDAAKARKLDIAYYSGQWDKIIL